MDNPKNDKLKFVDAIPTWPLTGISKLRTSGQPSTQQSIPFMKFAKDYAQHYPIHVKVTGGLYGRTEAETICGSEELIILGEKWQEVIVVQAKSYRKYSIPYGSAIQLSLLYDPNGNEDEALKETTLKTASDFERLRQLPKVLSYHTRSKKFSHEVLVVKRLDSEKQKLFVQSISKDGLGVEKDFDLNGKFIFSTNPDSVALYPSEIAKNVHAPCGDGEKAVLYLNKLSSSDAQSIKTIDPTLTSPVQLVEMKTEKSLLFIKAKSSTDSQLYEIPLDSSLHIEFAVISDQDNTQSYHRKLPDITTFNPKQVRVWAIIEEYGMNHAINAVQQIFNHSLRSGHEREDIEIHRNVYQEIETRKTETEYEELSRPTSIYDETDDNIFDQYKKINPKPVEPSLKPKSKPALPPKPKITDKSHKKSIKSPQMLVSPPQCPPKGATDDDIYVEPIEQVPIDSLHTDSTKIHSGTPEKPVAQTKTSSPATSNTPSISKSEESTTKILKLLETLVHQPNSPTLIKKKEKDILSPPDLCDIISELAECESLWYFLALHLRIPKTVIDTISANHSGDPNFCKRGLVEAVSYWLNNCPDPSWTNIVEALSKLDKRQRAREIAGKFGVTMKSSLDSYDLHHTHEDDEEIKELKAIIENKSELLQDTKTNITKHEQKLEHFEREMNDIKRKLKFYEEYNLILTYGSKMTELRNSQPKALPESHASNRRSDNKMYNTRIRNAQQETSKLRHQLHQIEDECQDIFRDLQLSQTSKFGLIRELTKLEEQLSLKLMSGYGIEVSSSSSNDESAEGHQQPAEYYNIVILNGKMEQKIHQREIDQLQDNLKLQEDEIKMLKDRLDKTLENLNTIEHQLTSNYCYTDVGDDLTQHEYLKNNLQADKVEYKLRMQKLIFLTKEMKYTLDEKKARKHEEMNILADVEIQAEKIQRSRRSTYSPAADKSRETQTVQTRKRMCSESTMGMPVGRGRGRGAIRKSTAVQATVKPKEAEPRETATIYRSNSTL